MDDAQMSYDEIYMFKIVQPVTGYARFGSVYKRKTAATRQDALDEIMASTTSENWANVTSKHTPSDLDMRFDPATKGLVFVMTPNISGGLGTVFGDKVVVDLDVRRMGSKKIVDSCQRHLVVGKGHIICSFEIDIPSVTGELNKHPGGHPITRLPIIFDFVDSDGVSPVFKEPHAKPVLALVGVFGHGGIHPRGGSSMILIA